MTDNVVELVTAALRAAHAAREPSQIFIAVPEVSIWEAAQTILSEPVRDPSLVHTLVQAIDGALPDRINASRALNILHHLLVNTQHSLIFATTQETVQHHADLLDETMLRSVVQSCFARYREQRDRDVFFAARALIAAVTLPLQCANPRVLSLSIAILVNEFPIIPTDPSDAAELAVTALKLLGHCYEHAREHAYIASEQIRDLRTNSNTMVAAEATYQYGVVMLTDAFAADIAESFFIALREAHDAFSYATTVQEQRTDAALFEVITACFQNLAYGTLESSSMKERFAEMREVLLERWYAFGANQYEPHLSLEYAFVQLLSDMEQWVHHLDRLPRAANIRIPLEALAEIYTRIRAVAESTDILGGAARAANTYVTLPQAHGQFFQIQEITAKLADVRMEAEIGIPLTEAEEHFYTLLEETLGGATDPKDTAAARIEVLRAAALAIDPALAQQIEQLASLDGISEPAFLELFRGWIEARQVAHAQALVQPGGPAHIITKRLHEQLAQILQINESQQFLDLEPAGSYIMRTLGALANYAILLHHASRDEFPSPRRYRASDVNFLFSEAIGGLGAKAGEGDLQNHCYIFLRALEALPSTHWGGRTAPQSIRGAPGRSDLQVVFPTDITIVIEVKGEGTDSSRAAINAHYIGQAQTYAAGTQRVSFLLVLDTTPKDPASSSPPPQDYCYVDQREVPGTSPVAVVVFIIPANRYRPSDQTATSSGRTDNTFEDATSTPKSPGDVTQRPKQRQRASKTKTT